MALGGDYHNVENTFGQSLMARTIVSKILFEKVKTGYFTERKAKGIAIRMFYNNGVELFKFEITQLGFLMIHISETCEPRSAFPQVHVKMTFPSFRASCGIGNS